jgi:hypothetical protein
VGFAYFLAFATGEEGFNDENGDGVFDDYRTTVGGSLTPEPFDDIGEIYAASAEFAPCTLPVTSTDPTPCSDYRNGENFYDFNNDGVRNGPDGKWEGVNCQETLSGLCASRSTTGVGTYGCIVMSGSAASFSGLAANGASVTTSLAAVPATISAAIADENLNVLPKGTKITLDTSGLTGLTATLAPSTSGTYTVGDTGCAGSIANWPARFVILLTQTTPPTGGSVGILVTTPSGAVSELVITL